MTILSRFRISRWLPVLLCVGMASCSKKASDRTADGRVIVDYWEEWTGFEGEAMQAIVDDFNNSQKKIFVKKLTVSRTDQKLMLAAVGGNPPDIAGLLSTWLPVFAERNTLLPVDGRFAAAGLKADDYLPQILDLCRHRGFLWGLPVTPASLALHWNKQLFVEAGLDPLKPPQTLQELDAMAERLTVVDIARNGHHQRVRFSDLTPEEKEKKDFAIVQMGFLPGEPGWWDPLWGLWFGGQLWNGSDRITAASPENVEAVTWFASFAKKYGLKNVRAFGASFGNFASPQNPFLAGRLGMVLHGVYLHNFIEKFSPGLQWGVAPFPTWEGRNFPMTIVETNMLVIPKFARHPKEAFAFIAYTNSRPALEKLAMLQRKFPPLRNVLPDFFAKHPNPFLKDFYDLAASPNARWVPRTTVWGELSDELNVAYQRAMAGILPPQAALDEVQKRMQWKLDRSNLRWSAVEKERLEEWRKEDAP